MGLDISVLKIKPVTDGRTQDDDGVTRVFTEFEGSLDNITPGLYEYEDVYHFRAGSYSTYNRFREHVSMALLERMPKQVWSDPHINPEAPGVALVRFSDCEGCIGPDTSRKLAKDLAGHLKVFERCVGQDTVGDDWLADMYMDIYQSFIKAFELAAEVGGVVQFH